MLRRSQTSTGTTVTVYAFGLEEHSYTFDSSGNPTGQNQAYYYRLGGSLLGALEVNGSTSSTNYFLSDTLGSVLATINNTVNSASVQGNQLYDPYGTSRYQSGSLNTSKGFTGQYNDGLTGLDYYGSRYYDPTVGVFLSADPLAGDLSGANPYEYVNANPETNTDPTGGMVACGAGCGGGSPLPPPPPVQPPSAPYLLGGTGGSVSNGNSSPCGDPTNSSVQKVPQELRTPWNKFLRGLYIKEWYDRGYPDPSGGWGNLDIHHILPREYGGTNDFWNLVPIDSSYHNKVVTPWWKGYNP